MPPPEYSVYAHGSRLPDNSMDEPRYCIRRLPDPWQNFFHIPGIFELLPHLNYIVSCPQSGAGDDSKTDLFHHGRQKVTVLIACATILRRHEKALEKSLLCRARLRIRHLFRALSNALRRFRRGPFGRQYIRPSAQVRRRGF